MLFFKIAGYSRKYSNWIQVLFYKALKKVPARITLRAGTETGLGIVRALSPA